MRQKLTPQTAPVPEPISVEEFAASLGALKVPQDAPLALAVSGGPDSMALVLCTLRWAQKTQHKLIAFIVDHALRPQSAHEANQTQEILTGLGIETEILRWDHPPIVSRLHVSARKARYHLLVNACRKHGASSLLLAHQREDQAETILMRLAKGSGIDGLAGMATANESDGIRLLRPLLNFSKERLIATCADAKIRFITDPSNLSDQFARGRLRRVLPLLESEGLTADRLIDLGQRAAEARDALDHYANIFLSQYGVQDFAGVVRIDIAALRSVPRAIIQRVMAKVLQATHRQDYAPEYVALHNLIDAMLVPHIMPPRTLHGSLISANEDTLTVMREYATITDTPNILPGEIKIWDGRWQVALSAHAPSGSYVIRPLGNPPHEVIEHLAPGLCRAVPQGRARAGLPALWLGGTNTESLNLIPSLTTENSLSMASATLVRLLV